MLNSIYECRETLKTLLRETPEFQTSIFDILFNNGQVSLDDTRIENKLFVNLQNIRITIYLEITEQPNKEPEFIEIYPRIMFSDEQWKYIIDLGTIPSALIEGSNRLSEESNCIWHLVCLPRKLHTEIYKSLL